MIVKQDHEAVISLAASQISHSFEQAVQELVMNSIDAEATAITVEVDPRELSAIVRDNGTGIASSDMALLGQKCCTSKGGHQALLGSRGLALAAITGSSPLTVISRKRGQFQTWEKAFQGRAGTEIRLAKQQQSRSGTEGRLTCFMINQPVRRGQLLQVK
jgi:DNA mismatch repair protein MutL